MKKVGSALAALLFVSLTACGGEEEIGIFDFFIAGENEVCDGDTCGGEGTAEVYLDIDPERGELCYEIELDGIEDSTAAHIHAAPLAENGDVVVDLEWEPGETRVEKCLQDLDSAVLERITLEPRGHYVNVHSERYPDGAARGQLRS